MPSGSYIEPLTDCESPEFYDITNRLHSDIFGLAVILFYLLARLYLLNKSILIFDFSDNPRSKELNKVISPAMDNLIGQALSFNPLDRFSTKLELKPALQSL